MSFFGVFIGTIFQLFLAALLFISVTMSMGNGGLNEKVEMVVVFGLPLSCLISAGLVIYHYLIGSPNDMYWWYIMPIVLTGLFLVIVNKFS